MLNIQKINYNIVDKAQLSKAEVLDIERNNSKEPDQDVDIDVSKYQSNGRSNKPNHSQSSKNS